MRQKSAPHSSTYLDDDARNFLRVVFRSRLADVDDVKRVVNTLLTDDLVANSRFSAELLADGLVQSGVLTRWQTKMLLRGKRRGFFLGSYTLRKPIGRGAMSVVYLGEHQIMKRAVALKILPPNEAKDPRIVDRFKRESAIAARLDHDNTARVFEFGEVDGKWFMAMEYVDGLNLHEVIMRDGVMGISFALNVIAQTASGLSHVHDLGIVHRDVKPSNLLLKNNGVVKIIDMGLGKMGSNELRGLASNRLLGTADFVAPEQIADAASVDSRADLYSLGCTLFFLLTGEPPFPGSSVSLQLAKHQSSSIPDVRTLRPDCPAVVQDLLCRMLAKRTFDRPRSMNGLLREIKMIQGSVNESHRPTNVQTTGDTVFD